MSNATSADTSPFNRGPQSGGQPDTWSTVEEHEQERKRTFLKMGVMVMTCCSKLAVLPILHSAVMIIIAAQTELGITAVIIAAAAYAE